MATSAEQDDRDDKDDEHAPPEARGEDAKAEGAKEAVGEEKVADAKAAATEEKATAASSEKDAVGADDEEAPRKPAVKTKPAGGKRPGAPGATGKGMVKARPLRPGRPSKQQGSSLGKSMILFIVIIGGLAAGFAILGRDEQQGPPKPKWVAGQTVDVELTLVKNDKVELACAAADESVGKHCAFESTTKAWSKGDVNDDKKLLKPYTTTDRTQFVAAGVWSEPALAPDKIPASRFSLKCKYKVDGMLKNLAVRWEQTGQWFPNNEWYAGSVSNCTIVP